ncbi:ER membrane protein complex subunit 1-like isoform X2 [Ostrea edulis]|uniref:ER membrane protein complex subunit 1-like isoform X2 n=1 Tax=Ostrea edulis TaxID=37623 RepID=UPI0024AF994C|nr:ER membrane protein complex subunit 1-like isoform X2 [Ostrea edulis]
MCGCKMTMTGKYLLFLSFLQSLLLSFGLYEDQIGKFDWHQQYVGKIKDVFWDQSFHAGKRLLVSSEKHVLASVHSHNGSLAWRKVLEEGTRGQIDKTLHSGNVLITINGGGRFVRKWNPGNGVADWDISLPGSKNDRADIVQCSKDLVAVMVQEAVLGLETRSGKQKWSIALPQSNQVVFTHLALSGTNLFVIGQSYGQQITIVTVDVDGVIKSTQSVTAPWLTSNTKCVVSSGGFLVCYRHEDQNLLTLNLADGQTFKSTSLQILGLEADDGVTIETQKKADEPYIFLRMRKDHIALLEIASHGVKLKKDLPNICAAQIASLDAQSMLFTLERLTGELKMRAYDLNTGGEMAELYQTITYLPQHGFPHTMEVLLFKKRDLRLGCRFAILSEDFSMQLVLKTGKIAWRREEALAYVLSVEMIDLPVSENQAKYEDEFGSHRDDIATMYMKRFKTQFSQLKTYIQQQLQKLQGHRHHHHDIEAMAESGSEDEDEELTRDEFNLNKLIILVTGAGKIYGVRSTNGHIEWEHFFPDLTPFNRYGQQKLLLYVQRTTAHFPNPPQCTIVGKHKATGNGLLFSFNPISGEAVDTPSTGQMLNFRIVQAGMLGELDDHFLRGILLLDPNDQVHVFPEKCSSVLKRTYRSQFLFVADRDTGFINGYRTLPLQKTFSMEKVWTVNLHKKQQTITQVVGKRPLEQVHSQGRVLGDRSVLYKYLNPNLVVVVTEGEIQEQSQKGPSSFINLYLLDSVTGHMVFHCSHRRAKGPVNLVHSENWVLYSYFSQKSRRHEMAVLELYEGKDQSNSSAFSSFSSPRQPLVLRQSYIMPLYISTMATTITEKGITSKQLIFALRLGGLLALPKALLDPRRPLLPTQETMEEGTIPYIPELPVNAEAIINYNQSLFNVQGVYTSPAGLESTSLVLAYGLDLYFTRIQPSKMFDVLKEDFDYFFISVVLLGMFVVTIVTQKLSARRALSRAWK